MATVEVLGRMKRPPLLKLLSCQSLHDLDFGSDGPTGPTLQCPPKDSAGFLAGGDRDSFFVEFSKKETGIIKVLNDLSENEENKCGRISGSSWSLPSILF